MYFRDNELENTCTALSTVCCLHEALVGKKSILTSSTLWSLLPYYVALISMRNQAQGSM